MNEDKSEKSKKLKELKKAWEHSDSSNQRIIADADKETFEKYNYLYNKFNLEVYPQPWYGNIINPEIIVLAINPSYVRNSDELDTKVYKEVFEANLNMFNNDRGAYLFNEKNLGINNIPFKYSSVSEWWEKVFEEIVTDEKGILMDDEFMNSFNKKVGIFNLVGYHSKNASSIECNGVKELDTVKKMTEYVKGLVNDNAADRIFVFVWGKALWERIGNINFPNANCYELNDGGSRRNKFIKNAKNKNLKNMIINKINDIRNV